MDFQNPEPVNDSGHDWAPSDFIPPRFRSWLYGVMLATAPILVVAGLATDSDIPLWIGLGEALLGGGVATAYRPTR